MTDLRPNTEGSRGSRGGRGGRDRNEFRGEFRPRDNRSRSRGPPRGGERGQRGTGRRGGRNDRDFGGNTDYMGREIKKPVFKNRDDDY